MPKKVVGLQVECHVIVGHGPAQVVLVVAGKCPVDIVAAVLRQQTDGLVKIVFSLFPLLARQADDAPRRPGLSVVRINLDAFLQRRDGFGGVFLLHIHIGLHGVGWSMSAPPSENGVNLGQRGVIRLGMQPTEYPVVPQVTVLRVVAQGKGIVLGRLNIVFLLDAAQSSQFVKTGYVWITLDGLRAVGFGPGKVVQIVFGHGTEEPRLVKIGLGRNGLIKILDGKDIVLVIKSRTTDGEQAVDIILGKTLRRLKIEH